MKCCAEGCDCQATPGWYCLEHASIRAKELMKIGKEVLATSPTASELNQGEELTEERVRGVRDIHSHRGNRHDDCIVALCDAWLSSRSSEAPSRRGEGDKQMPFKLPVFHDGNWIIDARQITVANVENIEFADAIVEALNKNTGAS